MPVLRSERVEGDELARLVALKAGADETGWRRYWEYGPPEGNVEWRRLGTFPGTGVFCGSFKGAVAALGDPMLLEWRYLSGVEVEMTGEEKRMRAAARGLDGDWHRYFEYGPPAGVAEWCYTVALGGGFGAFVFRGTFEEACAALGDRMLLSWRDVPADGAAASRVEDLTTAELARLGDGAAPADAAGGLDDGWRRLRVGDVPRGEAEWQVDRGDVVGPEVALGVFRGTLEQAYEGLNHPSQENLLWRPIADDAAADGNLLFGLFRPHPASDAAPAPKPDAPVSMLADCEALLAECGDLTGRIVSWTAAMDGRGTGSGEVAPQDGRVARLWLGLVALRDQLRVVADRLDRL